MGKHHVGHLVEGTHGVEVVDGPTAVGGAVGDDDDMVAGSDADGVMQLKEMHGHEVAVGSKGVVAGAHKAVDADALTGVGDAGGLTHEGDAPHVEVVRAAAERLLSQQVLAKGVHVAHHLEAVGRAVAFGHYHYIHFAVWMAFILELDGVGNKVQHRTAPKLRHGRVGVETIAVLEMHTLVAAAL